MFRSIATYLSRFPALKRLAKFAFQSADFMLHFHFRKINCRFPVGQVSGDDGGFFGYYDKSPESPDGKWILYHGLTPGYREKGVTINAKNVADNSVKTIGRTRAFNLQAGSRLHWIGENRLIYNVYDEEDDRYKSVIHNIDTNDQQVIPSAVYDTHKDTFLSIDYKNLAACRSEYGYTAHRKTGTDDAPYIVYGTFQSKQPEVLIHAETLMEFVPDAFRNTRHVHFNHVMMNPSGSAFVFLLRWTGTKGRREALFHYDFGTDVIQPVNHELTSHYCWVDDVTLFGYMSHNAVKGYYHVSVRDRSFRLFPDPQLRGDGHPTCKNGIYLTDTYPDSARMQHLLLIHGQKVLHAGSFFSPLRYHESERCDLHPRFNSAGNRIYIDSSHSGTRHLYRINFNQV